MSVMYCSKCCNTGAGGEKDVIEFRCDQCAAVVFFPVLSIPQYLARASALTQKSGSCRATASTSLVARATSSTTSTNNCCRDGASEAAEGAAGSLRRPRGTSGRDGPNCPNLQPTSGRYLHPDNRQHRANVQRAGASRDGQHSRQAARGLHKQRHHHRGRQQQRPI